MIGNTPKHISLFISSLSFFIIVVVVLYAVVGVGSTSFVLSYLWVLLCCYNKAGCLAFVVVEVIPFALLVIGALVSSLLALGLAIVLDAILLTAAAVMVILTGIDTAAALALAAPV